MFNQKAIYKVKISVSKHRTNKNSNCHIWIIFQIFPIKLHSNRRMLSIESFVKKLRNIFCFIIINFPGHSPVHESINKINSTLFLWVGHYTKITWADDIKRCIIPEVDSKDDSGCRIENCTRNSCSFPSNQCSLFRDILF